MPHEVEDILEDSDNLAALPTSDSFGMRNLTFIRVTSFRDLPEDIAAHMNYNDLKMQCQRRNKEIKQLVRRLNSEHEHERNAAKDHLER